MNSKRLYNKIIISFILIILLFPGQAFQSKIYASPIKTFKSTIATVFKQDLGEVIDYNAFIPKYEEALIIKQNLLAFPEYMEKTLRSKEFPDLHQLKTKLDYVSKKYKEFTILRKNLIELYESNSISLLPGEAITLKFKSYCLNSNKSSPSKEEFYFIDSIPDSQSKWLIPVLEYRAKDREEELPTQALIWNMVNKVPYQDLPTDQKDLLSAAIPDAERLYTKNKVTKKIAKKLFSRINSRVRDVAAPLYSVIDNINDVSEQIEERKSLLKLILPKYDIYQLENGLLIKAQSTGSYKELILTIANPKSKIKSIAINKSYFISHIFAVSLPILAFAPQSGKFGKWKDRWDKASDYYGKAQEAGKALKAFEKGTEGVENYAKGRGFDESMAVFEALNKGNSKFKEASDLFKGFNKQFLEDDNDKPKKFNPGKYKFRPGRGDVQPLSLGN